MILAPLVSSAATTRTGDLGGTAARGSTQNFCTRFSSLSQKYSGDLGKQLTNLQNRVNGEENKKTSDRHNFDATLQQHQQQWSQNRENNYAKLSDKATTGAQKQAVATFRSTVEAAVTARENAIAAARQTFRQALDQLVSQHQTATAGILSAYRSAVQAAIIKAQSDCAAGTAPATVRQNFQTALEAARAARKSASQNLDTVGSQVKQLAATRNQAIQAAVQTYQTALKAAIAALKVAFGQTETSTSSPSPSSSPSPTATP